LTYRGRPETIDETAEWVTAAGGVGIPARVDHTDEGAVISLFERIRAERDGRLDILVNDIWGGEGLSEWIPFWEQDTAKGFTLLERAINTHILTNRHGAPLMLARGAGLIVEVGDGDGYDYRGALFYSLAKVSVVHLAAGMAADLKDAGKNVTALAVTPGYLRSEGMLANFGVTEENWRDAIAKDPVFARSETPYYLGRAVAALACDPNVHARAGQAFKSSGLAREYGFTDRDGTQPE
jgi:NAD(P)-dependent dehydrogenase (short-subunit alcohol dehydrogenase family)